MNTNTEKSYILSLDLPKDQLDNSFQASIESMLEPKSIPEYRCSTCNATIELQQQNIFGKLPEMLICMLKVNLTLEIEV